MNVATLMFGLGYPETWIEALCLSLGHSIWLVGLLVVVVSGLERAIGLLANDRFVSLRYRINVVGLLLALAVIPALMIFGAPLTTSSQVAGPGQPEVSRRAAADDPSIASPPTPWLGPSEPAATIGPIPLDSTDHETGLRGDQVVDRESAATADPLAMGVVSVYGVGVMLMLVRLGFSLGCARQIVLLSRPIQTGIWHQRAAALARQWKLKTVPRLVECEAIVAPLVVGLWRPIIVVPLAKSTGLSPDQVELILAHELSHVRRWDVWVNGLQRLAEALLFFHPLVWILNRRISLLREFICDEQACTVNLANHSDGQDQSLNYAQALLKLLESHHGRRVPTSLFSLAATGRPHSDIKRRVARVLGKRLRTSFQPLKGGSAMAALLILMALLIPIAWLHPSEAATARPTDKATEIEPADRGWQTTDAESGADDEGDEEAVDGPILKGQLRMSDGTPIPGVEVRLYGGLATRFPGQNTRSNMDGIFRFAPLETGAYILDDEGARREFYTGVQFRHPDYVPADAISWRDIRVRNEAGHTEVLDLEMVLGGKIAGQIIDAETGDPVRGLDLRVYGGPVVDGVQTESFFVYASADNDGRFETPALFPGNYVIDINDGNYKERLKYPKIGRAEVIAGETVEVHLDTLEIDQDQASTNGALAEPISQSSDQPTSTDETTAEGPASDPNLAAATAADQDEGSEDASEDANEDAEGDGDEDAAAAESPMAEILWGPDIDGLQMGILPTPWAKRTRQFRVSDSIQYQVWIKNNTDETIYIPRDPRDYLVPAIRDDRLNLIGSGVFLSFGLSPDVIEANMLTIQAGESGQFASPAAQLNGADDTRRSRGHSLNCPLGDLVCFAKSHISYLQGGEYSNERSDYQRVELSSASIRVTLREGSRFKVREAYLLSHNGPALPGTAGIGFYAFDFPSAEDANQKIVVSVGRETLVGIEDFQVIPSMPEDLGEGRTRISGELTPFAQVNLQRYLDEQAKWAEHRAHWRMAITVDDRLVGVLKFEDLDPENFAIELMTSDVSIDQVLDALGQKN